MNRELLRVFKNWRPDIHSREQGFRQLVADCVMQISLSYTSFYWLVMSDVTLWQWRFHFEKTSLTDVRLFHSCLLAIDKDSVTKKEPKWLTMKMPISWFYLHQCVSSNCKSLSHMSIRMLTNAPCNATVIWKRQNTGRDCRSKKSHAKAGSHNSSNGPKQLHSENWAYNLIIQNLAG